VKHMPRRNDPCPCGSGLKYKYCCISKKLKPRLVKTDQKCSKCGNANLEIDLSGDSMNMLASIETPLKNFCKDNDFYLFSGFITVDDFMGFNKKLSTGQLNKSSIVQVYKDRLTQRTAIDLVRDGAMLHRAFESRTIILKDAIHAHFDKKYTLSVPVLFSQIEGLLRETGGLKPKEKFRSTVPTELWDERTLFSLSDNAKYFNAYITKLFEGQKEVSAFNRNTVLHGMNVSYDSEEWSLLLLLTVLEIRQFLWFEKTQKIWSCGISRK